VCQHAALSVCGGAAFWSWGACPVLRTWLLLLLLLLAYEPLLCQPSNLNTLANVVTSESVFECVLPESSVACDSKYLSER
jgi:hypothetical protein